MAIAIDPSSPAVVSGATSTQTTGAFNPPDTSVLVACVGFTASFAPSATITMSNTGTSLTWTLRARRDNNDPSSQGGIAAIYTAPNTLAQTGITVSAVSSKSGDAGGLKVLVVTGADLASPVGASGEGSSSSDEITPTVYTSTIADSLGVGIANDVSAQGAPTSTDVGFSYHVASNTSGIAVYKAALTTVAGTGVPMNFNGGGASTASWNWVAVEVLPVVPFTPQRGIVLGQAVNRASTY